MNKAEIRRKQLKKWFKNGMPVKDKSYFSQLINGKASFGEKAASRIEAEYGMPYGYLDDEEATPPASSDDWPFLSIKQELWGSLSEREKGTVEGYLKKMIEELLVDKNALDGFLESPPRKAARVA